MSYFNKDYRSIWYIYENNVWTWEKIKTEGTEGYYLMIHYKLPKFISLARLERVRLTFR